MASRRIQVHRVEEPSVPKGAINGLDNPAMDNQETVRSMAELINNESPMGAEEMPTSTPVSGTSATAPGKVNGTAPRNGIPPRDDTIEEEDEEVDVEEEGTAFNT